jgi:hypothetical protein
MEIRRTHWRHRLKARLSENATGFLAQQVCRAMDKCTYPRSCCRCHCHCCRYAGDRDTSVCWRLRVAVGAFNSMLITFNVIQHGGRPSTLGEKERESGLRLAGDSLVLFGPMRDSGGRGGGKQQ